MTDGEDAYMFLGGTDGAPRVMAMTKPSGEATLQILDAEAIRRFQVSVSPVAGLMVSGSDSRDNLRAALSVKDDRSSLMLWDTNERLRAGVYQKDDLVECNFTDPTGTQTLGIKSAAQVMHSFYVFNELTQRMSVWGMLPDGEIDRRDDVPLPRDEDAIDDE